MTYHDRRLTASVPPWAWERCAPRNAAVAPRRVPTAKAGARALLVPEWYTLTRSSCKALRRMLCVQLDCYLRGLLQPATQTGAV